VLWFQAKQLKWLALGVGMVRDGYEDARALQIDLAAAGRKALEQHYKLREQLGTTRGLIDIPGFDRIIDLIAKMAQ
jgi:hypothetical protein